MKEYHFRRMLTCLRWPGSTPEVAQHDEEDDGDEEMDELIPTQGKSISNFFFLNILIYIYNFCFCVF